MCGIVGGIAKRPILPILLEGLKRLEYRGYDSAGVAVAEANAIERVRAVGKVERLVDALSSHELSGCVGIAHTRWATHGAPSEQNAHPHMAADRMVMVHNGIVENYQALKSAQIAGGREFHSDTDTEVVVYMIDAAVTSGMSLLEAVQAVVPQLQGTYALAVMHRDFPDELVVVRSGSPLVIGLGVGETFVASDSLSLLPVTSRFIYLEEGDVAHIHLDQLNIFDAAGDIVYRPVEEQDASADAASRGHYKHFMLKEVHEQPEAIQRTASGYIANEQIDIERFGPEILDVLPTLERVRIVACGTSYHAGLTAKYWFEDWAGIPCDVEIASELRYRSVVVPPKTLLLTISQSGETADTLAALRQAKEKQYAATMTVCNVPTSSLVRESDWVLLTQAGPEIGVASTKAFTAQLTALYLLCTAFVQLKGDVAQVGQRLQALASLPHKLQQALALEGRIQQLAERFIDKHHALFLGRGLHFPIALEGALKLKEISYIHAEGYPAGELKHGPLALIDEEMPVIAIAPDDHLLEKLESNLQEVQARGGCLILFADETIGQHLSVSGETISVPQIDIDLAPILYTVPLQLLSYHVAVLKGTDVDQPRNLAKSVTVE